MTDIFTIERAFSLGLHRLDDNDELATYFFDTGFFEKKKSIFVRIGQTHPNYFSIDVGHLLLETGLNVQGGIGDFMQIWDGFAIQINAINNVNHPTYEKRKTISFTFYQE